MNKDAIISMILSARGVMIFVNGFETNLLLFCIACLLRKSKGIYLGSINHVNLLDGSYRRGRIGTSRTA